ncbi:MAG: nidogen-like domain-containing protein [Sandaracinus sp.]
MRRLSWMCTLAVLGALTILPRASAQCAVSSPEGWHQDPSGSVPGCVNLNGGLGGAVGYGSNTLTRNDDEWTGPVDLTPAFPGGLNFYGGPYTTMWINTNGNITFNAGLSRFTPAPFPLPAPTSAANRAPMIAAYWGDVDTRAPTDGPAVQSGHDLVYYDLRLGQVTITWFDVGYFSHHYTSRMSFQMILRNATSSCGSGDFDVEFRYNRCEWVAGTASGSNNDGTCTPSAVGNSCTPANVGFDANDGMNNWVTIPEALTNDVVNVCINSNIGQPGVYQWAVRGGALVCPGGGTPCDTGEPGACGIGVNVCHAAGLTCQPVGQSGAERCDNIDNDCDGQIDNGSGLCPGAQVCVAGTCITGCIDGGCGDGYDCDPTTGACIEHACVGMTCPANQRCLHGSCVDSCTGVTCPHNQQCAAGRCVNLCDVLTCDDGQVCVNGQCVPTCPCTPCAADEICGADGRCTATNGCDVTICDPGFYCRNGTCLDACDGATCPANQHCEVGNCVDNGTISRDGGGYDAGIRPAGDGGGVEPGIDGGTGRGPRKTGGCGCRTTPTGQGGALAALGLGLVALIAARRRREKR